MTEKDLQFIGYFPKVEVPVPDHLSEVGVATIASVSECIAPGPAGWVDLWLHNRLCLFESLRDAERAAQESNQSWRLFAYRALPWAWIGGEPKQVLDLPSLRSEVAQTFARLGFDVVSRNAGVGGFECSPLSCNGMATEIPVNGCCLLGDFNEAVKTAVRFSLEQPEAGPYYVVEVLGPEG